MNKPKYSVEIDTNGAEASGFEDRLPWVCYGTIQGEGDSLDEVIQSATVDLIDQDGGERGVVEADENWMVEAMIAEFRRKYPEAPEVSRNPDRQYDAAKEDGEV